MRVLIVEDEAKLARLVAHGLSEEGHVADVAGRGEDALWMAKAAPYDAIVLDVLLPGLDGFATCRELRANEVPGRRTSATAGALPSRGCSRQRRLRLRRAYLGR